MFLSFTQHIHKKYYVLLLGHLFIVIHQNQVYGDVRLYQARAAIETEREREREWGFIVNSALFAICLAAAAHCTHTHCHLSLLQASANEEWPI